MRLKHACAVIFVVWTLGSFSWAARGEDQIPSRLREGRDVAWVKRAKFSLESFPAMDSHFCLALQPALAQWKEFFLFGEESVSRLFDRSHFQHAADVVEEVSMEAWSRIASNKFVSWAKAEQERLWDLVLQHLPGDFATKPRFSDPYLLEARLCLRVRDALLPTCLSKLSRG